MEDSGLTWRKTGKSGNGGECVEVAFNSGGRSTGMVRDSKSPERGHLTMSTETFAAFLANVKRGELDL